MRVKFLPLLLLLLLIKLQIRPSRRVEDAQQHRVVQRKQLRVVVAVRGMKRIHQRIMVLKTFCRQGKRRQVRSLELEGQALEVQKVLPKLLRQMMPVMLKKRKKRSVLQP